MYHRPRSVRSRVSTSFTLLALQLTTRWRTIIVHGCTPRFRLPVFTVTFGSCIHKICLLQKTYLVRLTSLWSHDNRCKIGFSLKHIIRGKTVMRDSRPWLANAVRRYLKACFLTIHGSHLISKRRQEPHKWGYVGLLACLTIWFPDMTWQESRAIGPDWYFLPITVAIWPVTGQGFQNTKWPAVLYYQ